MHLQLLEMTSSALATLLRCTDRSIEPCLGIRPIRWEMVLMNRRRRLGEGSPLWTANFGVVIFLSNEAGGNEARNHDGPSALAAAAASASQQERLPHRPHNPPISLGKHRRRLIRRIFLGERKQHITPHRGGGGKRVSQVIITRFCLLVHRRRGWSAQQPRRKSPAVSIGIRRHSCKFSSKARQGPAPLPNLCLLPLF